MDSRKRERLEAKGWKVGTIEEFLGFGPGSCLDQNICLGCQAATRDGLSIYCERCNGEIERAEEDREALSVNDEEVSDGFQIRTPEEENLAKVAGLDDDRNKHPEL